MTIVGIVMVENQMRNSSAASASALGGLAESLGHRIRKERKARSWSQQRAAKRIDTGLPQATWSAWENDRQLPNDHHLAKLCDLFGWDRSSVAEEAKRIKLRKIKLQYERDGVRDLTDEVRALTDELRSDFKVFVVQPSLHPLLCSETYQQEWAENLSNGVDYEVLWFLDSVELGVFDDLHTALTNIEALIRKSKTVGKIKHYATHLRQKPNRRILEAYHALGREKSSFCVWEEHFRPPDNKWGPLHDLLLYWNIDEALICYLPNGSKAFKKPIVRTIMQGDRRKTSAGLGYNSSPRNNGPEITEAVRNCIEWLMKPPEPIT